MRKWLVGLLALACVAATSFAEGTATLPVEENYTTTQDWKALEGFSGSGVSTYSDGRCKFDKNNQWLMVQFDGTPGELTFDVKGNAATGTTLTSPASFLVEASADTETWTTVTNLDETAFSTAYASFGPYALAGDVRYVRWTYVNKYGFNLGLNNVKITSGGPAVFSVTFDKENWFKVKLGEASSVTAIPKNGIEPYTFLWDSDTPELKGGTTATLEIPDTLAEGDYTVACLVTEDNGEGDAINALIGFTVEAVPVITGDIYTLVENADDFEAGAEYLIVSYSKDKFTSALKNEANGSRIGVEEVEIAEDKTVTTGSDAIVWTIKAGEAEGQYVLFNEAKNVYAAGPSSEGNNAQLLSDGSDALAQWTLDFSGLPAVAIGSVAYPERQLTRNSTATYEYFATYKGSGTKPYLFKKSGATGLSVTFDKANGFTVDFGTADSITATAKNGAEPYTYEWTSDTPDLNGTGETLAIPATLAAGDYTVMVTVTDADSNVANKLIGFTVVAPAVKYDVEVAIGIPNGSVSADKAKAEEGEEVTLSADPASGYKLGTFLVDGGAITGNKFNMPAHDVLVSATFVEVTGETYVRVESADDFEEGADYLVVAYSEGKFSSALKNEASTTRLALEEVVITEDNTIVTDSDAIVWTIQAGAEEGQYVLYNAAKGVYAAATKDDNVAQLLEDGTAALAQWTLKFDAVPTVGIWSVSYPERWLSRNSTAGNAYFAAYKGTQTAPFLFKKAGPASFTVTLDKADGFTVEEGSADSITATAKNGSGDYSYAWTGDLTGDSATLEIPATLAAGNYTVKVTATDNGADAQTAEKEISFSVVAPAAKYQIQVAIGIPNGSVSADKTEAEEGETVTLTATPDAGYKLEHFLVNDIAISANTFPMPAEDVLVSASFVEVTGETYVRVESADDFEEGADYLVVAYSEGKFSSALKNEASTTRLALEEVVINEDNTIVTDSDAIVWTIQAGAEEGQYVLYNAAKGVYAAATKDDNVAQLLEDGTAALAQWTLKFDAVPTVGIWSVSYPERWLSRNSTAGNAYFAAYKGTQTAPFLFKKAGPASFTVTLDKADGFSVVEGTADSITATAKNGSGDYSYAWTGDLTGDAATLEIPATLAAGTYTVKVTATDNGADAQTAEKSISFSVVAKYQIACAIGIPNGSVSADKTEAVEGEVVTLTAYPADGYKLEHFLVNDIAISANTFPMPAEDVLVSASFVEITGETYTRVESAEDFEEGAEYLIVAFSKDKFTSALKNEASTTRIGVDEVVIAEDNTVTTDSDAIVWQIKAGAKEGQYVLFNAAKGVYAAGPKSEGNNAQLLTDGADALAQWTLDFTDVPAVAIGSVAYPERQLTRNSTATYEYFATYKGSGTKPYLFKKSGPATPKITFTGDTTVQVGGSFELQFELKNYDGDYTWEVASREGGSIDADGLYTWTPTDAGDMTITVVAKNGELDIASKDVALTVTEPGPQPGEPALVFGGDKEGTVGTPVNFTVEAINMANPDIYGGWMDHEGLFDAPEGSTLSDAGVTQEFPNVSFVPDIAGDYVFYFNAGDGDEYREGKWTVTVTGEGPGPQPTEGKITNMTIAKDKMTIEFEGEGAQVLLSDDMTTWTPVDGAISPFTFDMKEAGKKYIGVR